MDIYKLENIILNGVDELFEENFNKLIINLKNHDINYLLILSCQQNQFSMAKYIYKKTMEYKLKEKILFLFIKKEYIITKSTLEICLLRAITNGNLEMYQWLINEGVKIPEEKNKLYFKNACIGGNQEIITDIYYLNKEIFKNYLTDGIKICLEKGYFEIFLNLRNLEIFNEGSWIFFNYLKSDICDIKFFEEIYRDYHKYLTIEILYEFIKLNRLDESKILINFQRINNNTTNDIINTYIKSNNINFNMLYWLLSLCCDINLIINYVEYFILNKFENFNETKIMLNFIIQNIHEITNLYNKLYNVYNKIKYNDNFLYKNNIINTLLYLIDIGAVVNKNNDFYEYYNEKIYKNIDIV
jgi:hypothetical protein